MNSQSCFFFLLVAMSYINALIDRCVFDAFTVQADSKRFQLSNAILDYWYFDILNISNRRQSDYSIDHVHCSYNSRF